ncbi:enamine deaminase RidA (YjgF/YER057c/UK114 family) [Bogoriella caseilytica]|uniref:Enamine deaminase RidA (YjgF/YER057c/UK114 family) n=1 Tax=Bogoriella caseilytica TaxID=56055 RepID=A0A3N2BD75_9MICO|nr:enamine deaminase RidA (YjgF/YER057c/UK114 family) [Bogoriella caseilytica]
MTSPAPRDVNALGSPSERLAALGLVLPPVPAPVAAYVPAVAHGGLVYSSGQLPMVAGSVMLTGKVGAGVDPDQAQDAARICALNALAAVAEQAGGLDRIARVLKVTGFVASDPGFTGQPVVLNGASELIGEIFGEHARSAVGVAVLPLDAAVEVEIIAALA